MKYTLDNSVIERRVMELKNLKETKGSMLFDRLILDFEKAMAFYHDAHTHVNRRVRGEDERNANRYADCLFGKTAFAIGNAFPNLTGMQKLEMLSEFEGFMQSVKSIV